MRVLGLDPSLTAFGWALHDTEGPPGDRSRCPERGRLKTLASMEYIERYMAQREGLREVIRRLKPDKVGIEFPVFGNLWSEGMYGLFLFCSEALKTEGCDVVFWTPLQIKAHARESLGRPKGWVMDKPDMVDAAKEDAGPGTWNHNEADAYLCAVLAGRFWKYWAGLLDEPALTAVEAKFFAQVWTPTKGSKMGQEIKSGMVYREDERFFRWSATGVSDGEGK